MSNIFFQPILKKIDHTIESKLSSKHWEIKLAVFLALVIAQKSLIAFLFPSMNRMILPGHYSLM